MPTDSPDEPKFTDGTNFRGLPRTFWYLCVGAFVNKAGGFIVPFLALYLTQDRGLSVEQAGVLGSLYGAGSIFSGPIGGFCADRFGRRSTLVGGMVLGACAMLVLGWVQDPRRIAVAVFALGFFGDLYRPAVSATIADIIKEGDRARAFEYLYWAINLGFSVAPLIAGAVVSHGFKVLFAADAATTLVYALIVWVRVPETRPVAPPKHEGAGGLAGLLAPYHDRIYLPFVFLQFAVALIFQQFSVALPIDMRAHGISPSRFGMLIAINGALIVVLQPVVIPIIRRHARSRVLALGALLTGIGFGLTGLMNDARGYAISIALWTLGEILIAPVGPTVVADLSPPHLRGGYQGAYHLSWGASNLAAPLLGAAVLAHFGSSALWGGCFGLGCVVAIAHLAVAGARARRLNRERDSGADQSTEPASTTAESW